MRITTKVKNSFWKRLVSIILLGRWITNRHWNILCDKQNSKGIKKYGHSIDECPKRKYAWKIMAIEELIDFWIYKEKMKS
jgi:hypothetical protein